MNIQIGFPELCLACGTTLMALGFQAQFWFLSSLAIIGAIIRAGLDVQFKKDELESKRDSVNASKSAVSALLDSFYKVPGNPTKKDYTTH